MGVWRVGGLAGGWAEKLIVRRSPGNEHYTLTHCLAVYLNAGGASSLLPPQWGVHGDGSTRLPNLSLSPPSAHRAFFSVQEQ